MDGWIADSEGEVVASRINDLAHIHVLASGLLAASSRRCRKPGSIQEGILGPQFPRGTTRKHAATPGSSRQNFLPLLHHGTGKRGILFVARLAIKCVRARDSFDEERGSIRQRMAPPFGACFGGGGCRAARQCGLATRAMISTRQRLHGSPLSSDSDHAICPLVRDVLVNRAPPHRHSVDSERTPGSFILLGLRTPCLPTAW